MSVSFTGNVLHTIDAKGRVTIPVAFREALGTGFTIGMNSDLKAVALYPRAKWERIEDDLALIPETDARGMRYVRLINGNAFTDNELDPQGRVLLPAALRQKAELSRGIRFIGMGQYLEVWDEVRYDADAVDAENDKELQPYVNETYIRPAHAGALQKERGE